MRAFELFFNFVFEQKGVCICNIYILSTSTCHFRLYFQDYVLYDKQNIYIILY